MVTPSLASIFLGEQARPFLHASAVVGQEGVVDEVGQALLARDGFGQNALAAQVQLLAGGELVGVFADELSWATRSWPLRTIPFAACIQRENYAPRSAPEEPDPHAERDGDQ
jgi:hypothetical protein